MTGTKHDQDKPNLALIYPPFLTDMARGLMHGEADYGPQNWRKLAMTRIIAAAKRHINAINAGEDIDPDSGIPHAALLADNAMFLHWFAKHPEAVNDDRVWKELP